MSVLHRTEGTPVACARCGVTGWCREGGRLPVNWELYRGPVDPFGPVWCAACIEWLLDDLDRLMRRAPMR